MIEYLVNNLSLKIWIKYVTQVNISITLHKLSDKLQVLRNQGIGSSAGLK